MKVFTIKYETNDITVHDSIDAAEALPDAERFRTEGGLAKLTADWPMARLVEIWNGLPGVTPIVKFKDRATGVARIWKAIQTLEPTPPLALKPTIEAAQSSAATEPVAGPESASASEPELPCDGETTATELAPDTPNAAPTEVPAPEKATHAKRTSTGRTGAKEPRENSKTNQVISMLKREGGTTVEEIMTAMGWQKHTTRAMLSAGGSLTKKHGLTIVSEKVAEKRVYTING